MATINHHLSLQKARHTPEGLFTELRILLFFIEFNILIFVMICRQKMTQLNPGLPPALQPAPLLLALVDTEYRFLLVDIGASGSSLDAQIFKLSEKIKTGTREPLGVRARFVQEGRGECICNIKDHIQGTTGTMDQRQRLSETLF